jgi:hypothetical protein
MRRSGTFVVAHLRGGGGDVGRLKAHLRHVASPRSSCEICAHCPLRGGRDNVGWPRPHLHRAALPPSCCEISAQALHDDVRRAHAAGMMAEETTTTHMPSAVIRSGPEPLAQAAAARVRSMAGVAWASRRANPAAVRDTPSVVSQARRPPGHPYAQPRRRQRTRPRQGRPQWRLGHRYRRPRPGHARL